MTSALIILSNLRLSNNTGKGYSKLVNEIYKIPATWVWSTMGEIAEVIGGGTPKTNDSSNYEGGKIPWITPADLSGYSAKYIGHGERFITEKGLKDSSARMMPAGTILFSSRAPVGYVAISSNPVCTNQGFKSFVLKNGDVLPDYVYWWLKGSKELAERMASGTTFLELSGAKAKQIPIPIAPLDKQKLIIAEIEKQFSRLDEAVANLKRVKANLKRYKAAVLKAAVEGKLTEEWRKVHSDVEPASELLKRILSERKKKWEDAFPKKKYAAPVGPEIENLPSIPDTWTWTTLPQLGELNRGKSKHRPRNAPKLYGGPYPFIQTGDVRHASGNITHYEQTYSEAGLKQSKLWPKGTLCITIAANIADTAILGMDACFPDSIVGFIPESEYVDVRYVEYFIRTAKENIERFAPSTAQKNINLEILYDVAVPLPPLMEQRAIIDEIEQKLSVADDVDKAEDANSARAERLRQTILKNAFSGNL